MQDIKVRISKEVLTPSNTQNFEGVLTSANFKFSGNEFVSDGTCSWSVDVINGGEGYLFVTGKIKGSFVTKCVRCLEPACAIIESTVEGYVKVKPDAKLPNDVGDDECEELEDGKFINLSPFLEGAIMLDLPLQPLCDENCDGLFEYCDHDDAEADPSVQSPFAVLKNFDFS